MGDGPDRPFRYTRKTLSWETRGGWIYLALTMRAITWGLRRTKPILYHPIGMAGTSLFVFAYILNAWLALALILAVYAWAFIKPDSYLHHADPRIQSFRAGFKYRWRPRNKLKRLGLLADDEPVQPISRVTRQGSVVNVTMRMSYGDDIEYFRQRSTRIAQTYGARDCIINPHRRETINPFKHHQIEKYRWIQLEFLTKNPFTKPTGVEYINHYLKKLTLQQGDPIGPKRDGTPYLLDIATHLYNISITGGGKSNAERTMIYAGYRKIMAGLRENWICDLKRGIEAGPMKHCFARVEDGKQGPQAVLQFWTDIRNIMHKRLDQMEEQGIVTFVPSPGDPELHAYFDETSILETVPYAEYRKAIYATITEVLVQGRAAKISVRLFTQNPKLEKAPLRDDVPEVHLGKVKTRNQVGMAMDYEAHDRGARANEIDLPGIYYAETESAMTPTELRYSETTIQDMQQLPQAPTSALWKPAEPTEEVFVSLPTGPEPKPEPIPAPIQTNRLHLNSARRPGTNGNGNGNGQHPEQEKEEVMK